MQYREGHLGRIIVASIEHGDDLLVELSNIVAKEKINSAVVLLLGALKEASVVVGPKECTVPPVPVWRETNDGREIIGIATVFKDENGEPSIHMHASLGRGDSVLTGCIRKGTEVYLLVEAILFEIEGSGALRLFDQTKDLKLLGFK